METKTNLVQLSPEVAAAVQRVAQFEATYCDLTSQVANYLKSNQYLFKDMFNDPYDILDNLLIDNDKISLTLERITSGILTSAHLKSRIDEPAQ